MNTEKGPENDPDNCRCPRCQPRQWLVADLAEQIRQRDDALDELVMAAELSCLYRDDRAFERLRKR